jgi:hypothetical protein
VRWLLLVLAFVLGAVVTWFLTVKRASRTLPVPAEADRLSEEVPGDAGPEEEATRFGGTHTAVSDEPGAAEAWDRDAQDEDALMPRTPPDVAPVVDATPNGDLAGVGEPDAVAAVDAVLPLEGDGGGEVAASQLEVPETRGAPAAGPTQGELTFDQPEESVPPEDKP